jgi:hypothetical protein
MTGGPRHLLEAVGEGHHDVVAQVEIESKV